MLNKRCGNKVNGNVQYNELILIVTFRTKPKDTDNSSVHITTNEKEENVEKNYVVQGELIDNVKGDENLIILGHWNATVE